MMNWKKLVVPVEQKVAAEINFVHVKLQMTSTQLYPITVVK